MKELPQAYKIPKTIVHVVCSAALCVTAMGANAQHVGSGVKATSADSELTLDRGSQSPATTSDAISESSAADKVQFIVKNETHAEEGLVKIERGASDDLISADVSNAILGELATAMEDSLGIAVEFDDENLAAESVADVRFLNETQEIAIGQLFRGFSHISYVQPGENRRIIKIYSVAPDTPPTPRAMPVRPKPASEQYANLDALRSLKDYEDEVEHFKSGVDGEPPGANPNDGDEELRLAEQEQAEIALQEARTRRALDALALEHGTRIKSDAISELADSDDPEVTDEVTDALLGAVQDASLAGPVRQHALETLLNRSAGNAYSDLPIVELLETFAKDESYAVSSTALRSLASVRRELARPRQAPQ